VAEYQNYPPEPAPRVVKPAYHVPSMQEINALPRNGYKVASTFSGCGGSCLGYEMAGYDVVYANEFIPAAQETYRANHPATFLDTRDIRKVKARDIQDAMSGAEIDLFDGSPPCAAFSSSGSRQHSWGKVKDYSDTRQRVDDLFFEYTRLIKDLQPKTFVAENVSGLVKGAAKGFFLDIYNELKSCGYEVEAKLLDASWLGVPQKRERIIFVGVRRDLARRFNVKPVHPRPLPYQYSVKDALPYLSQVQHTGLRWKPASLPCSTIVQSGATVSPTAQMSGGSFCKENGKEPRRFTIPELKRICGFPDDFKLTGSFDQQWERLGRAVPPVMMSHIAKTVQTEILDKIGRQKNVE